MIDFLEDLLRVRPLHGAVTIVPVRSSWETYERTRWPRRRKVTP
jgi:hypothetical protein